MMRLMFALALTGLIGAAAGAEEPQNNPQAEKIPAPKTQVEQPILVFPAYQRSDTREVWQHYGVNSMGRFARRVIVTPHGAYYSRDLQPYPWTQNRTTAIMPTKVD